MLLLFQGETNFNAGQRARDGFRLRSLLFRDFDWQFVDVPPPGGGPGGIRLYYYRNERAQAERALRAIQSAYARLVEEFAYNPTKRIPYILYASQREFQTTNVFAVPESVLGVTSPDEQSRWHDAMRRIFPDVKKGDRLIGVNVPGRGAKFFHNGAPIGEIADIAFARAFFGIWLDPKTSRPDFRRLLLGER